MNKANDSAFPAPLRRDLHSEGLTKREYFAMQFMAAIISKSPYRTGVSDDESKLLDSRDAHGAVRYADALLAELEKADQ